MQTHIGMDAGVKERFRQRREKGTLTHQRPLANRCMIWLYGTKSGADGDPQTNLEFRMDMNALSATYEHDGYVGGVPILTQESAAQHRETAGTN